MMPNMPMQAPPPMGPAPTPGGGAEQVSPDEVKAKLIQLLSKVQQIAEQNGVDFNAIVKEFLSGQKGTSAPPPPPPPVR